MLLVAAALALPWDERWNRVNRPVRPPVASQLFAALSERVDLVLSAEAKHLSGQMGTSVREAVVQAAIENDLDALFLLALMKAESAFDPEAISHRGAVGLLQVHPSTARWVADRLGGHWSPERPLSDPWTNVRLGAAYLSYLLGRFGDEGRALVAYYQGPNAQEDGWGGDPADDHFAAQVLSEHRRYRALASCHATPCSPELEWAAWWKEGEGVMGACRAQVSPG